MAKMDAQSFDKWAAVLGTHAAGEVLMLAVARACGDDAGLWHKAHSVGIPWRQKTWTALSRLQERYNGGVKTELRALLERERTGGGEDDAEFWDPCGGEDGASPAACAGPYAPKAGLGTAPAPKQHVADNEERHAALSGSSKELADTPPLARAILLLYLFRRLPFRDTALIGFFRTNWNTTSLVKLFMSTA